MQENAQIVNHTSGRLHRDPLKSGSLDRGSLYRASVHRGSLYRGIPLKENPFLVCPYRRIPI